MTRMTKVLYTEQQRISYPVPCTLPLLVSSVYIRLAHARVCRRTPAYRGYKLPNRIHTSIARTFRSKIKLHMNHDCGNYFVAPV